MIAFEVKDMTCGHCVGAITQALKATDPQAKVHIDLATHQVQVEAGSADSRALAAAITEAGYTPVPMGGQGGQAGGSGAGGAGSCGGQCRCA